MDPDHLLAMQLQEQCDELYEPNNTTKGASAGTSNSLVSASWELYDPNPDIHTLFQLFSEKYFWNELGSVEVKWSKRMYSCAGTTTYKGNRGCVVSLSLPLLKLRPRKDLVETLLHEMIHAYLFVADKDREREEHGPKFRSHMNRINRASGTNITVYHSFHDEVKHYKNHWWRCNGPCTSRPPYYGIVKRSMNRAPGPNDFWFEEHRRSCGGEFIKVKEPEGFKSRKSKTGQSGKENSAKQTSLDNFVSPNGPLKPHSASNFSSIKSNHGNCDKDKTANSNTPKSTKPKTGHTKVPARSASWKPLGFTSNQQDTPAKNIPKTSTEPTKLSPNQRGKDSKIAGFFSSNEDNASIERFSKANNIHGFTGLSSNREPSRTPHAKGTAPGAGLISNRAGTLVEKPRPASSLVAGTSKSGVQSSQPTRSQAFTGQGKVLNPNCKPSEINRSNSSLLKLFPAKEVQLNAAKKARLDDGAAASSLERDSNTLVNCPVCNIQLTQHRVNEHLDACMNLEAVMLSVGETVLISDDDTSSESLQQEANDSADFAKCPVCGEQCSLISINSHLDACLQSAELP